MISFFEKHYVKEDDYLNDPDFYFSETFYQAGLNCYLYNLNSNLIKLSFNYFLKLFKRKNPNIKIKIIFIKNFIYGLTGKNIVFQHKKKTDYIWPTPPKGWQFEIIVFQDRSIEFDFLHPVSARFWSEHNDYLEQPFINGHKFNVKDLLNINLPYMTTFNQVKLNTDEIKNSHLKIIN